jgi:RNA polymerase sigma-70 factor (ECF subfamily)
MSSPVFAQDEDDDARLLARYRGGDRDAFGELVARYQKPIYNAAYRLLGTREDASDVAQSVFLRIVERLDDYDPKYRFFSWIYRIAVNESIDVLRRTRREDPLDEETDYPAPNSAEPHAAYEAGKVALRIQRALMAMKTDDRVVITLRHFSECGYAEMAAIIGVDEKTVKSRLFEARRRLAGQLEDLRGVMH